MLKIDRGKLDDTLAAMLSNPEYRDSYLFYAHMVGQCSIKIRHDIGSCAGVAFNIDHYNLYINPTSKWIDYNEAMKSFKEDYIPKKDDIKVVNGVKLFRILQGFDDYSLKERLFILQHEMHHILGGHVERREDRVPKTWNYATDCAINQLGNQDHMPEKCVNPATLSLKLGVLVPENKSSEFYYELIKKESENNSKPESSKVEGDGSGGGSGDDSGSGQGLSDDDLIDSHDVWDESVGDEEFQADITKKMIETAQTETIKSKGTVPSEFSKWMELFTRKAEVNWKKVLRGIVGNKRVGSRSTIMRRDRRFPKRADLRGKTKERMFNLLVIPDVSGSMPDQAIISTLGEVRHVCDITKTEVDMIQVDAQAYQPEKLTKKTKVVTRKGNGGTMLFPAIEMARAHKIEFNAVIVLTDGGLFGSDIDKFAALGKKVIWLVEANGTILPEMNSGLMRAFKLKE